MRAMQSQRNLRTAGARPKFLLFFALGVLLLTWFALAAPGAAQEQSPPPKSHQQSSSASGQESLSQELVKETREAAGEDDAEQFKHSSSVRWIAQVTGLNLEHAYLLCVLLNFLVIVAAIFLSACVTLVPGANQLRITNKASRGGVQDVGHERTLVVAAGKQPSLRPSEPPICA